MAVADGDNGKIITTLPIGPHVDATAFDRETGLIFFANNGSVTIIHQDSPDKYSPVETAKTQLKTNTLALDPKSHKIYMPGADFGPPPAPTPENPHPAPPKIPVPGTFKLLILGR
jgi:hypothetical protein